MNTRIEAGGFYFFQQASDPASIQAPASIRAPASILSAWSSAILIMQYTLFSINFRHVCSHFAHIMHDFHRFSSNFPIKRKNYAAIRALEKVFDIDTVF